jgi:hypothetical protein
MVAMIKKNYGEKDVMQFKESWMLLIQQVTHDSEIFNWDSLLPTSMSQAISRDKYLSLDIPLAYFMSSYMLGTVDVVKQF